MPKKLEMEYSFACARIEAKKAAPMGGAATEDELASKPDGWFRGYGSTFNDPHPTSSPSLCYDGDWQDIVDPGAFDSSLKKFKTTGLAAMFYNHDIYGKPLGKWDSITTDKTGLVTEGRVSLGVQDNAETYSLMKDGAIGAESIGFFPVRVDLDNKKKVRTILEVDLFEVSVVTLPGNASAKIMDVKSAFRIEDRDFDIMNKREFERALREGRPLSASEAKRLIAGGYKALTETREAGDVSGLVQSLKKFNETILAR